MNELPPQGTEVVIAAIARNIEKSIVKDFNRISSAFSHFKQHWIVIESDSTDNSVRELKKLQKIYSNFTFTTLGKLETKYPRRMERLAVARNQYLKILENSQYSNVDYLVVADLNNLNNRLTYTSVNSNWSRNDWAMVAANQSQKYYDVYALRHYLWAPNDPWEHHKFLRDLGLFPELALYLAVHSKMLRIHKSHPWINVDSAFGGIAIYRKKYLQNALYKGINEKGEMVCEHVSFNHQVRNNGGELYINPDFLNTNWTDHSRNAMWSKRIWRIAKYPFKARNLAQ